VLRGFDDSMLLELTPWSEQPVNVAQQDAAKSRQHLTDQSDRQVTVILETFVHHMLEERAQPASLLMEQQDACGCRQDWMHPGA